jgi:type VI secretion system secreted protein Hcp
MAAVDYFLKIDGVEGESQAEGHRGEIEILSFSWGESQAGQVAHGGGGGAGKVSMQDFHFTMRTSKASPTLFLGCATGMHFRNAVLIGMRGGERQKQQQPYLKFTLSDVLVSSYNVGGGPQSSPPAGSPTRQLPSADDGTVEAISLNFSKIEFEYRPQNADGSIGGPARAGWDLRRNTVA